MSTTAEQWAQLVLYGNCAAKTTKPAKDRRRKFHSNGSRRDCSPLATLSYNERVTAGEPVKSTDADIAAYLARVGK